MPATDDDDRDERTTADANAPPPGYGEPSTPGELAAMAREARRVAAELDAGPAGREQQHQAAGLLRLLAGAVEGRIREGGGD